ncbi:MAG: hypothetical protein ACLQDY_07815 [Streptosporangiaceae bacterium]
MTPLLLMAGWLVDRARSRIRSALGDNPQAGALTLEWIVIAGILVAAAVAAGVVFKSAISAETAKLP